MNIGKNMEEIYKIMSKYNIPFKLQDEWVEEATFDIGEHVMRHYVGGKVVEEYKCEPSIRAINYEQKAWYNNKQS